MVTYKRHIRDMSSMVIFVQRTLRNCQEDLWACNKNSHFCLFSRSPKTSFFSFSLNSPVSVEIRKTEKALRGVDKPNILHPRLCQLIDGKYPISTSSDGKKTKSFFVGVMTSSYRMLQPVLFVSYLCQSFSG